MNALLFPFLIAVVCGVGAAMAYRFFTMRLLRDVERAWLGVYEYFLKRADRVPLLIETIRAEVHGNGSMAGPYEGLLHELIEARAATAAMPLPSLEKAAVEKNFAAVLERVLEEFREREEFKKNHAFIKLLKEFSEFDAHLSGILLNYHRATDAYRVFTFGCSSSLYRPFSY